MAYTDATAIETKWQDLWYTRLTAYRAEFTTEGKTYVDGLAVAGVAAKQAANATVGRYLGRLLRSECRESYYNEVAPYMASQILSRALDAGKIVNRELLWRDRRDYMDDKGEYSAGSTDQKVPGRAVTYAADPSPATTGQFFRLTTDHRSQKIESGKHNQTITAKIIGTGASNAGAHRSIAEIKGGAASDDNEVVDYRKGSGDKNKLTLEAVNEVYNPTALITNMNLYGNTETHGDTVSVITGFTLTNVSGSPTVTVDTTNVWRSKRFCIRVAGASTSWKAQYTSGISIGQDKRYTPYCIMVPIFMQAGWAGDITIVWGGKSQAYTEADLSGGAWAYLKIDRDSDLFPLNFDADDATVSITIATDAANANYVVLGGIYVAEGKRHEGVWYFHFSHTADSVLDSTVSWADSCDFAGKRQDLIAWMHEDDEGRNYAYLCTTGTNTLADG
jgi:hypothetical protein